MAEQVDRQNADDPSYQPMALDPDNSIPFQAALSLVMSGRGQPNGYTDFVLRDHRLRRKSTAA